MKTKEYLKKYCEICNKNYVPNSVTQELVDDLFNDFLALLNKSSTIHEKAFANACNAFESKFKSIKAQFVNNKIPFPDSIWDMLRFRINLRFAAYFPNKKYYHFDDKDTKSMKTEYRHKYEEKFHGDDDWKRFYGDDRNFQKTKQAFFNASNNFKEFGNASSNASNNFNAFFNEIFKRFGYGNSIFDILGNNMIDEKVTRAFNYFKLNHETATIEELKAKRKELILKYHPDKGGNEEVAKNINTCYDIAFKFLEKKQINNNEQ